MDTNPEEFVGREPKWEKFLPGSITYFPHFTKLEQHLIRNKHRKLINDHYRQKAYDSIIETLVFKEEQPTWTTVGTFTSGTPYTGASVTSNSLTLGNTTVDEDTLKHMKAHLQSLRKELQKKSA